jgi:hypothetical protein
MTEPTPPRLCGVCTKPLPVDERKTCVVCIGRARRNLLDVREGYSLLHGCMSLMSSPAPSLAPARSHDTLMPGGDALVLLGPGSEGKSDEGCIYADDVDSISGFLDKHWTDWRHCWGWRAATVAPHQLVGKASAFLSRHMERAATDPQTADHFPEFAAGIKALRGMVWKTTGQSMFVIKSPAPCFQCGQPDLVREYDEKTGLNDLWTCRHCDREYDMASYWLAVHALLEAQARAAENAGDAA